MTRYEVYAGTPERFGKYITVTMCITKRDCSGCTRDTESFVEWLNGEATEAEIADVEIDWDNEPAEAHNEGA